jgi:hypothetical protein
LFRTYENDHPPYAYITIKIQSMKHLHFPRVGEKTTMAALIAVLYFSAIMLFAYVFTLT